MALGVYIARISSERRASSINNNINEGEKLIMFHLWVTNLKGKTRGNPTSRNTIVTRACGEDYVKLVPSIVTSRASTIPTYVNSSSSCCIHVGATPRRSLLATLGRRTKVANVLHTSVCISHCGWAPICWAWCLCTYHIKTFSHHHYYQADYDNHINIMCIHCILLSYSHCHYVNKIKSIQILDYSLCCPYLCILSSAEFSFYR